MAGVSCTYEDTPAHNLNCCPHSSKQLPLTSPSGLEDAHKCPQEDRPREEAEQTWNYRNPGILKGHPVSKREGNMLWISLSPWPCKLPTLCGRNITRLYKHDLYHILFFYLLICLSFYTVSYLKGQYLSS